MKPLKERIRERAKELKELIKVEKAIDRVVPTFEKSLDCEAVCSVYSRTALVYLYFDNPEVLEEKILPQLSKTFQCKWEKRVDKEQIVYTTTVHSSKIPIYVTIYCQPTNSCQIIAIPTGKTKTVTRTVQVEEPEYEYLVNCGGDSNE